MKENCKSARVPVYVEMSNVTKLFSVEEEVVLSSRI